MTINEIAKMAGVSRATVSRYLNNGYVSQEKQERIREIIEKTGYSPSVSAQLLRSNRTNLIGVVIPKINSDSISRMVEGISQILNERGMQMMLACTNNNEAEEVKYIQTFSENHVDGIILIGTIFTPQHHALFKKLKTPLVILSQKINGFSCIYSDDYHAAYSMGKKLVKTAKKVGLIMVSERDIAVGQNRKSGLIDSFEEAGIRISEDYIRTAGFTMESGYEETGKLIEAHPDIDTIVCATDTIASGAIKKLHDLGIRIPEDVQIAGFGDSQVSSALTPSLTTIHFYYEEAGHEAAQILMKRVEGADTSVVKEMQLAYDTIVRESTR